MRLLAAGASLGGNMYRNDKTKLVCVRLTDEQYKTLNLLSSKSNITVSEFLRKIIQSYVIHTK